MVGKGVRRGSGWPHGRASAATGSVKGGVDFRSGPTEREAADVASILGGLRASSALASSSTLERARPGLLGCDEATALWFLRDRGGDVAEASAKLGRSLSWRAGVNEGREVDVGSDVGLEAVAGKSYVHDRADSQGRPVVCIVAAKHAQGEYPIESSVKLTVQRVEAAISQAHADENTDGTFLAIFDLRGFGPKNFDLELVKFLIDVLYRYYPRRLHRCLLVGAPFAFRPVWAVVKPLLKSYASLVTFEDPGEATARKYFASASDAPPALL